MSEDEKAGIKRVCREIADNMERDASDCDGKPFDPAVVAEYLGKHGAAIAALAKMIGMLV